MTAKCSVLLWQLICFMGHPVSPQAPDYEHRGGSSCAGIQRHQSPFTSHLSFLQGGALKFRGLFSSRVSKLLVADTLVPSPWSDALRSTLCLLYHINIILRGLLHLDFLSFSKVFSKLFPIFYSWISSKCSNTHLQLS